MTASSWSAPMPPTNIEAEQHLLGVLLAGTVSFEAVAATGLGGRDFADPVHTAIFAALRWVCIEGDKTARVRKIMEETGALDEVGGPAYLRQLVVALSADVDTMAAAAAVQHHSIRRSLIDLAGNLARLAAEVTDDALEEGQPVPAPAQAAAFLAQLRGVVEEVEDLIPPGGAA